MLWPLCCLYPADSSEKERRLDLIRLVLVDGQRGFSLGLSQAAVFAVAAALTTVVFALLLPSSVFAAPEKPPTAEGTIHHPGNCLGREHHAGRGAVLQRP